MTLVRRVARPLLAAVFVSEGLDRVRHPGRYAEAAKPLVSQVAQPLHLPDDPELLVRANGAAMAGAGTLLTIGRFPRLSALVLAVTMVPSTYVQHAFWAVSDPEAKKRERTDFLKGLALIGGLLIAALDTEGRPGVAWRSRRAAKDARRAALLAKRDAARATKGLRRGRVAG